nr:unnamed protein product [Callosobruchus analis]CAI5843120.1 unnamed protein product [Callosobruchus analis]
MFHYKEHNRSRWRCKSISKTRCKSSLLTTGRQIRVMHEHNHELHVISYDNLHFLGIIYFGKAVKYPKIIFKDYEYHLHVKEVHKTRWHCQKHKRNKCKAFIYTTGNTVLLGLFQHNHPPDVIDYEKLVPKQVAVRLKV